MLKIRNNMLKIVTETYFYLAKQKLNVGLVDEAAALFKQLWQIRFLRIVEVIVLSTFGIDST